jgi:hypothetical protein
MLATLAVQSAFEVGKTRATFSYFVKRDNEKPLKTEGIGEEHPWYIFCLPSTE